MTGTIEDAGIAVLPHSEVARATTRWAIIGLSLLVVATWLLEHPYHGLVHDSTLYTLAALARVHPQSLANDLFLRFGSQDRYTIFSPLYAGAINLFGLERAAQILTAITHLGFFTCAWLLARRLMPPSLAVLAVGLLVALPSTYGSAHVFATTEEFLTPRQPAEAFVLAALAAALGRRYVLAGIALLIALLLHPIIAAAGVVLLAYSLVGASKPRLAVGIAVGGVALVTITALAFPAGPFDRFDDAWLRILETRFSYLFPSLWSGGDWGYATVPLAVLIVGAVTSSRPPLRSLCIAALVTALIGIAVTLFESDFLHIIIVTQMQMWRWLWIANVLAVLVLPLVAVECWHTGGPGRATTVLLAAAWIGIDTPFAAVLAFLACGCAITGSKITQGRHQRLIIAGAWALLLVAAAVAAGAVLIAIRKLTSTAVDPATAASPLLMTTRALQPWMTGGVMPAAVLLLAWWFGENAHGGGRFLLPIAAAAASALLIPFGWKAWTHLQYPAERHAAFAEWRDNIPPGAEVFWPDTPVGVWYLLERSSYFSLNQLAGAVFSRASIMYAQQREATAATILPRLRAAAAIPGSLSDVCVTSDLAFLASWNDLGPTPFAPVAPNADHPNERLRLYRCADLHR